MKKVALTCEGFFNSIQHFFGVGVGAIVKGQRDGMGVGDAGMKNRARLEQRQLHIAAAARRNRQCQREQHAQDEGDFLHDSP